MSASFAEVKLVTGDNEHFGYGSDYYFEFKCDSCRCFVTVSGDAARFEYKDSNDKWVVIPDSMDYEEYAHKIDPDAYEQCDTDCMEYDSSTDQFIYNVYWSNEIATRIVFDNVVITINGDDDDDE